MGYITTNHRFIIDDKHPADVFDEMENFFSLYTVAIDDLAQVSVQLSVPPSFGINDNKKLADGYRQFTKALKYTLPDIHLLPVKIHAPSADRDADEQDDDNSVILLIQRLDSQADEDNTPSLYTSVLGKLLPRFGGDKADTGLYPVRETMAILPPAASQPMPTMPQPVQSTAPVPQSPQLPPQSQQPQPTLSSPPVPQAPANPISGQLPTSQRPAEQVPGYQPIAPIPVAPPAPVATPQAQPQPVSPAAAISPAAAMAPRVLERLPNIAKSAKPYQDLLTQAVVRDASQQRLALNGKPIQQITLKSSDSLTTAAIEQLFFSFNHSKDKSQSAHDALDLVSYGHEVLKPQLAKLGLTLAEDAQFGLKTTHQATEMDRTRLARGDVFANEITLTAKLKPAGSGTMPVTHGSVVAATAVTSTPPLQFDMRHHPSLNANAQGITLNLVVQDALGTRQQAIRKFPMRVVTGDQASRPDSVRVYGIETATHDELLRIIELDGNVMLDGTSALAVYRNGQALTNGSTLMPNDILTIDQGRVTLQLRLA